MLKPLKIYSSSNYYHPVDGDLPELKSALFEASGKKIRRIDRLTQLALIGCFQCKSSFELSKNTGLYMSSIFGSINNTTKVLGEIYQERQCPSPLRFVNTVSNAACFYIAEQLGLFANNQFVTRDHFTLEAGVKLASLDLELGNVEAALVGVVCEVGADLNVHRERFQTDSNFTLAEASHWLYLAHDLNDGQGKEIATISDVKEPIDNGAIQDYLKSTIALSSVSTAIGFSDSIDVKHRCELLQSLNLQEANYKPTHIRHEFSTAINIGGFLETNRSETAKRFIHLDKNQRDQWSAIVLEKSDSL